MFKKAFQLENTVRRNVTLRVVKLADCSSWVFGGQIFRKIQLFLS